MLILKRKCLVRASRVRSGESGTSSTIIYVRWSSRRYELGCDTPVAPTVLVLITCWAMQWQFTRLFYISYNYAGLLCESILLLYLPLKTCMVIVRMMINCVGPLRADMADISPATRPKMQGMVVCHLLTQFHDSMKKHYSITTHWTYDVIIRQFLPQNDVATSFQRNNDVIIKSYMCLLGKRCGSVKRVNLPLMPHISVSESGQHWFR